MIFCLQKIYIIIIKFKNMTKFLNKWNFILGVHLEVRWDASWDG